MRIATYNIWNNDTLFEERMEAISKVIKDVDADILSLQEVRNEECRSIAEIIAQVANYPFFMFRVYPDCPDEGLAILSKFPLSNVMAIWETDTEKSNFCAIKATIEYEGIFIGITNVHLNWRSEEIRREQLNSVINWIIKEKNCEKYEIMCGDFNDIPQSKTHNWLRKYGWQDCLELTYIEDLNYYVTFDLLNNPYLKEDKRVKEKLRFDWIMLNTINNCGQPPVTSVDTFGNKASAFEMIPSDHYGLCIDIDI